MFHQFVILSVAASALNAHQHKLLEESVLALAPRYRAPPAASPTEGALERLALESRDRSADRTQAAAQDGESAATVGDVDDGDNMSVASMQVRCTAFRGWVQSIGSYNVWCWNCYAAVLVTKVCKHVAMQCSSLPRNSTS